VRIANGGSNSASSALLGCGHRRGRGLDLLLVVRVIAVRVMAFEQRRRRGWRSRGWVQDITGVLPRTTACLAPSPHHLLPHLTHRHALFPLAHYLLLACLAAAHLLRTRIFFAALTNVVSRARLLLSCFGGSVHRGGTGRAWWTCNALGTADIAAAANRACGAWRRRQSCFRRALRRQYYAPALANGAADGSGKMPSSSARKSWRNFFR